MNYGFHTWMLYYNGREVFWERSSHFPFRDVSRPSKLWCTSAQIFACVYCKIAISRRLRSGEQAPIPAAIYIENRSALLFGCYHTSQDEQNSIRERMLIKDCSSEQSSSSKVDLSPTVAPIRSPN